MIDYIKLYLLMTLCVYFGACISNGSFWPGKVTWLTLLSGLFSLMLWPLILSIVFWNVVKGNTNE